MGKIRIFFEETSTFKLPKRKLFVFIKEISSKENYYCGDINIILCNDDFLLKMNKKYLRHDYFTDILTFDFSEKRKISGDLYISMDRIKENAVLYKKSFKSELFRVIIHGILHLLGYEDKSKKEVIEMRKMEDEYVLNFLETTN